MKSSRTAKPLGYAGQMFDARYKLARSCVHCTDTADSFNRYISTYCHLHQKHLMGFGDFLDECRDCINYRSRKENI